MERLANTPVIGWERITTYTKGRKNPKTIVEKSSLEVKAWELAALGFVGATFYWLWTGTGQQQNASQGQLSSNPAAWFFGGPLGAWIWGTATGK